MLRALKVSYSDAGEGGVAVNCEKNTIFLELSVCSKSDYIPPNGAKLESARPRSFLLTDNIKYGLASLQKKLIHLSLFFLSSVNSLSHFLYVRSLSISYHIPNSYNDSLLVYSMITLP